MVLGVQVDSVIEVTGCKPNVTETSNTQKDVEAGKQKNITQNTRDGKNLDCVIFCEVIYGMK